MQFAKQGGDGMECGETRGVCKAGYMGAGMVCEMVGDGECTGDPEYERRGAQKPKCPHVHVSRGILCTSIHA